MKQSIILLFTACCVLQGQAQVFNPVHWTFTAEQISGDQYDLIFHAKIDRGWHIYGQDLGPGGPVPTSFTFEDGSYFKTAGRVTESDNVKTLYDKIFEMELIKFSEYATFKQRVTWTDTKKPITGYLTFMTCNNERCLAPLDVDFSFTPAK